MSLRALFVGALAVSAQLVAGAVVPLTSASKAIPPKQDPWYSSPIADLSTVEPGTVLRARVAPNNVAGQLGVANAYQFLYRTTDSHYNPTFGVTTLLTPKKPKSPGDSFLLSYQLIYNSADLDVSPSYLLTNTTNVNPLILKDLRYAINKGYFLLIPDYEGSTAAFTAGVVTGHTTLDSVRAALSSGYGLSTTSPVKTVLWGNSGGGIASEWAAELQSSYAPELYIAGVVAGSIIPNTTNFLDSVTGTGFAGLAPQILLGLASQYPIFQQELLDGLKTTGPYNKTNFLQAYNFSTTQSVMHYANQTWEGYFKTGHGLITTPNAINATSRDGLMGYHGVPQMPMLVYKGIADEISSIDQTDALVARYCAAGANIWYLRNRVGGHEAQQVNGYGRATAWIDRVFAGTYTAATHKYQCLTQTVSFGNDTTPL